VTDTNDGSSGCELGDRRAQRRRRLLVRGGKNSNETVGPSASSAAIERPGDRRSSVDRASGGRGEAQAHVDGDHSPARRADEHGVEVELGDLRQVLDHRVDAVDQVGERGHVGGGAPR
jgi:hypothetical protein